jgi:hypothetical protein
MEYSGDMEYVSSYLIGCEKTFDLLHYFCHCILWLSNKMGWALGCSGPSKMNHSPITKKRILGCCSGLDRCSGQIK